MKKENVKENSFCVNHMSKSENNQAKSGKIIDLVYSNLIILKNNDNYSLNSIKSNLKISARFAYINFIFTKKNYENVWVI